MSFLEPTDAELGAAAARRRKAAIVLYRLAVLACAATAAWFSYQGAGASRTAMIYAASAESAAQKAREAAGRAESDAESAADYAREARDAIEDQ